MKINPINATGQRTNYPAKKNNFNQTNLLKDQTSNQSPSFKGSIIPSSFKKAFGAAACFLAPVVFPNPATLMLAITCVPFLLIAAVADFSDEKNEDYRNRNRGDL